MSWNRRSTSKRPVRRQFEVEHLEERTLLSTTTTIGPAPTPAWIEGQQGTLVLHPQGISQTQASPVTVSWGDGSAPQKSRMIVGTTLNLTHTYTEEGSFHYKVKIGQGATAPQLTGTLQVADAPLTAVAGVGAQDVTVGKTFNGAVASFVDTNAKGRASDFSATIDWGDGSGHSQATKIVPDATQKGLFHVYGKHLFTKASVKPYVVTVNISDRGGQTGSAVSDFFASKPVLSGPLTGTYTESLSNPDTGNTFTFNGSGILAVVGPVTATGSVQTPGNIASGHATGTLTLTLPTTIPGKQVTDTLQLTGPVQTGSSQLPGSFTFRVSAGPQKGQTGTIQVQLTPNSSSNAAIHPHLADDGGDNLGGTLGTTPTSTTGSFTMTINTKLV